MTNRIFLTTILPEHLIGKHRLSFAAANFSANLMSGGGFDKVYSILPLYVGGEMETEAFGDKRFELVYNHRLRKCGGRMTLLACLAEQWKIFKRIPKGAQVWTYNLNTLYAFTVMLLKMFKPSVQVNVIVLDFTPVEKGFGLNRIYLKMINRAHGNICLANSDLFTCSRRKTLPGVVPAEREDNPKVDTPAMSFLLSGALNETISQTSMVLEAFAQTPQCTLHVTGFSDNAKIIEEYAANYPNIVYHRQLPFKQYLELLHSVTFQLSTRKPDSPENQCNFPSKIIEALLHNRAIVTTIHYPQLDGVKVVECLEPGIEAFKRTLNQLAAMSDEQLSAFVNQGDEVWRRYSPQVWYETMRKIEESK